MKLTTRKITVAALFMAGFFMLVLFGAMTYRNTVRSQSENYNTRSLIAYLTTCARANDTAGALSVSDSEYGQVLELLDGDT